MQRKTIRSIADIASILLLMLGVTIPCIIMFTRGETPVATTENRPLAEVPSLEWNWNSLNGFPAAFEKYFDDHFGFRQTLTQWHHLAAYRLFGMSPHSSVVIGQDGWLYLDVSISDYGGERRFSESDLELRTRILQERHDWLAAQGIHYLVVLVPNKPTIYPQHLPKYLQPLREKNNLELLEEYAADHGSFELLDLTDCLIKASRIEATYPSNDCHWNDYGAYVAYCEIMSHLRKRYPELVALKPDQLAAKEVATGGDLGFLSGIPDEFIEPRIMLEPKNPTSKLVERTHAPLSFYSEISTVEDSRLPRAVVFHDSFMTNQRIFLSENFSLTRYLRIESNFDPQAIVEYRPQIVIQEIVERMLPGLVANPPELARQPTYPRLPSPPLANAPLSSRIK